MEDKTLVCVDCGEEFVFTVGEQEFYKEKGFENDPKRCPKCRKAKKAAQQNRKQFEKLKGHKIYLVVFFILFYTIN